MFDNIESKTEHLVIEFEYPGRFETILTNNGFSESKISLGFHQVYVSRRIGEPWMIHFTIRKLDNSGSPLFVRVSTLEGEVIYTTVFTELDGY